LYGTKNDDGNENYEQQEGPKVIASVQSPIVDGTHKIGQKQFSLVNCIPTSWVRFIKFYKILIYLLLRRCFIVFIRIRVREKTVINKVVQLEHWN